MALARRSSVLGCGVVIFSAEGGTAGQRRRRGDRHRPARVVGPAMYVGVNEARCRRRARPRSSAPSSSPSPMTCYLALFVGAVSLSSRSSAGRRPIIGVLGVIGALAAHHAPPAAASCSAEWSTRCSSASGPIRSAPPSTSPTSIGDDPVLALRAIREALVLPYAGLRVDGAELATSGVPVTHTRTAPARPRRRRGRRARRRAACRGPRTLTGRRARPQAGRAAPGPDAAGHRAGRRPTDFQGADRHRPRGGAEAAAARPPRRSGPTPLRDRLHLRRGPQHLAGRSRPGRRPAALPAHRDRHRHQGDPSARLRHAPPGARRARARALG